MTLAEQVRRALDLSRTTERQADRLDAACAALEAIDASTLDVTERYEVRFALGVTYGALRRPREMFAQLVAAIDAAEEMGDLYRRPRECWEQALALADASGDAAAIAAIAGKVHMVARIRDFKSIRETAESVFDRAWAALTGADDADPILVQRRRFARTFDADGNSGGALELLRSVLADHETKGQRASPAFLADVRLDIVDLLLRNAALPSTTRARADREEAITMLDAIEPAQLSPPLRYRYLDRRSSVRVQLDQLREAYADVMAAIAEAEAVGDFTRRPEGCLRALAWFAARDPVLFADVEPFVRTIATERNLVAVLARLDEGAAAIRLAGTPLTTREPWSVVFDQIANYRTALALMQLVEGDAAILCANDLPLIESHRTLAERVAEHLNRRDGDPSRWTSGSFSAATRTQRADMDDVQRLIDASRRAGVVLVHRWPGTWWRTPSLSRESLPETVVGFQEAPSTMALEQERVYFHIRRGTELAKRRYITAAMQHFAAAGSRASSALIRGSDVWWADAWIATVHALAATEEWEQLQQIAPQAIEVGTATGATALIDLATRGAALATEELALIAPTSTAWDHVVDEIRTRTDAIVFGQLVEIRGDQALHANASPTNELTDAHVARIAALLDPDATTSAWQTIVASRRREDRPSLDEIGGFIARCGKAGVRLRWHVPRDTRARIQPPRAWTPPAMTMTVYEEPPAAIGDAARIDFHLGRAAEHAKHRRTRAVLEHVRAAQELASISRAIESTNWQIAACTKLVEALATAEEWERVKQQAPEVQRFATTWQATALQELAGSMFTRALDELAMPIQAESPWDVVAAQITETDHAEAFAALVRNRGDQVLHANRSPIDELARDTMGALARIGGVLDADLGLAGTDWENLSDVEVRTTAEATAAFVARCRAAGVRLVHRLPDAYGVLGTSDKEWGVDLSRDDPNLIRNYVTGVENARLGLHRDAALLLSTLLHIQRSEGKRLGSKAIARAQLITARSELELGNVVGARFEIGFLDPNALGAGDRDELLALLTRIGTRTPVQRTARPPWEVVLELIQTFDDAKALLGLLAYADYDLFANDVPLSIERSLVEQRLATFQHGGGDDGTPTSMAAFLERCREAGVELRHQLKRTQRGTLAMWPSRAPGDDPALWALLVEGRDLRARGRPIQAIGALGRMLARHLNERIPLSRAVVGEARLALGEMLIERFAAAEAEGHLGLVDPHDLASDEARSRYHLLRAGNLARLRWIGMMLEQLALARAVAESATGETAIAWQIDAWTALVSALVATEEWEIVEYRVPDAAAFAARANASELARTASNALARARTVIASAATSKPPWQVVLEAITDKPLAKGLASSIPNRGTQVLHANASPLDELAALFRAATPDAARVARLLGADDCSDAWAMFADEDNYYFEEDARDLVVRCHQLGVRLAHRSPDPWKTVLGQIAGYDDALALICLFEYRRDELWANERPIDDILSALPSERGVAAVLAERLNTIDGADTWGYEQLYSSTRGLNATPVQIADFVARCRRAGVHLHHRPGRQVVPSGDS